MELRSFLFIWTSWRRKTDVFNLLMIHTDDKNIGESVFYHCCLDQSSELRWAVARRLGWELGRSEGHCSPCAFGMAEESLESLSKGSAGKGELTCPLGSNSSKAALLAFQLSSEGFQGAEGKVVFSPFSSSLHLQALIALCCWWFLSLPSNPKISRGATQHLLFSSSAYKLPFPSGKPNKISMCTHTKQT